MLLSDGLNYIRTLSECHLMTKGCLQGAVGVCVSLTHMQTLLAHTHTHTHMLDETAGPDTAETIQSEIVINDIRILHSLVPLRD